MLFADACQLERVRLVAACTDRTDRLREEESDDPDLQRARHNEICEAEIMLLEEISEEFANACARLYSLEPEKLNAAATALHAQLSKGAFNRVMDHVGATYQEVRL